MVIVEKCGLWLVFIMFHDWYYQRPVELSGDCAPAIQHDYDKNQPLWRALPEFVQKISRERIWPARFMPYKFIKCSKKE